MRPSVGKRQGLSPARDSGTFRDQYKIEQPTAENTENAEER